MGTCCSSGQTQHIFHDTDPLVVDRKTTGAYGDTHHDQYDSSSDEEQRNEFTEETELSDDEKTKLKDEWMRSVHTSNNRNLKYMLETYGQQIDFISIVFENGDNSLHTAVRTGNEKLCQFLLMCGIHVCIFISNNNNNNNKK